MATGHNAESPRGSVYIVEDQPIMRETYQLVFEHTSSLRVCGSAASGEEALEELSTAKPDLVLVDLSLPGMSGIELVKKIAAQYPQIRIVVTSGYTDDEHIKGSRDAGAHGFVPKGDMDELQALIKRLLPSPA